MTFHVATVSLSFRYYFPYAGFRLACRLPLCRVIIACCFRVAALSGNAALALSPSGIAPELNRIQLSAICRGGQSGKVIDLLAWRCLPLGHPSAASGACAVEQISSSKRQCGKRQVSLKPALLYIAEMPTVKSWNQGDLLQKSGRSFEIVSIWIWKPCVQSGRWSNNYVLFGYYVQQCKN